MASKSNSESQSLASLATLFRLLSDKNRLQIVMMLAEGERDVTSVCKELRLAQPTVSHHLGLLRMNRIIINKRAGKRVIYTLDPAAGRAVAGKLKFTSAPFSVVIEGF